MSNNKKNKKVSKNDFVLVVAVIVAIALILGGIYYLVNQQKDKPVKEEKTEIEKIIEENTPAEKSLDEATLNSLGDDLEAFAGMYEDVIDDYNNDPNEENEKKYKETWRELSGFMFRLDGMIGGFDRDSFAEISDKIIEIDDVVREKDDADKVYKIVEEIKSILERVA